MAPRHNKRPNVVVEEISVEREIAEEQLERLRITAQERLLTYEEVKIYDLLVKNLHLSKEKGGSIPTSSSRVEDDEQIETTELLKLADVITEEHVSSVLNVTQDEQEIDSKAKDRS